VSPLVEKKKGKPGLLKWGKKQKFGPTTHVEGKRGKKTCTSNYTEGRRGEGKK